MTTIMDWMRRITSRSSAKVEGAEEDDAKSDVSRMENGDSSFLGNGNEKDDTENSKSEDAKLKTENENDNTEDDDENEQDVSASSGGVEMTGKARQWLERHVWAYRRVSFGAAVGIACLWGILAGLWTPRGPLTKGQALGSLFISLLVVGYPSGLVTRSAWTMLWTALAFQIVLELMRLRVDGPTVDKPHFTRYGTVALASGRGVHFLLSVIPMLVGIAFGFATAQHLSENTAEFRKCCPRRKKWVRYTGHIALGLSAIGMLALMIALAIPARTDGITTTDDTTESVAELTSVNVNGHNLALMIRGHSVDNPVLLFLAGGPGGSELGAMRNHLPELERYFTVVTWDQRGCGKSYVELDPLDTISPEGYIDDTIQVTDYLRSRFDQDRIYLLGQSWGTLLGVLAVQKYPDRYKAYIGTGQMVSALATDIIMYNDTIAWARSTGRDGLVDDLVSNGPPPYKGSIYQYETFASKEHDVYAYDHSMNSEGEGGFSENMNVEEYNLIERMHLFAAFLDTYAALYPQIQDYDLREGNQSAFEIPAFFVQGVHEARARSEIFNEWYPTVTATVKDLVLLNTSGHRPLFEQPQQFVEYMADTVLALT